MIGSCHMGILDLYSPQECANYFTACGYDAA
jgi:hypothetical protein